MGAVEDRGNLVLDVLQVQRPGERVAGVAVRPVDPRPVDDEPRYQVADRFVVECRPSDLKRERARGVVVRDVDAVRALWSIAATKIREPARW